MASYPLISKNLIMLPGCNEIILERIAKQVDAKEINSSRFFPLFSVGDVNTPKISLYYPGVGSSSIAIALKTMAGLGAKCFFLVGAAGSLRKDLDIGDIMIPLGAVRDEAVSRYYAPITYPAIPSLSIVKALINAAERLDIPHYLGVTWTVDVPQQEGSEIDNWQKMRVNCVEMEVATFFVTASLMNVKAGSVLLISDKAYEGSTFPKMLDAHVVEGYQKALSIVLKAIEILDHGDTQ